MEFDKILVPVTGSSVDESAIQLACSLATKPSTRICAVYVIELKRSLSLDAEIDSEIKKGEAVLRQAREAATRAGCEIDTDLLQAREVGIAVVDEARESGTSVILLMLAYKKRFGVFTLGTAAPYILKQAPCPVLLVREQPP